MILLAIETSCDDTGVAILQGREILANVLSSQVDMHALFGGIVPELAARKHLEALLPLTRHALKEGGVTLDEVDCIGVTVKPGLVPSLLVGLSFAKALAFGLNKPIVGVDHLEAHTFSIFLEHPVAYPFISLVASGGHTALFLVQGEGDMYLLGQTRDDAAGEAFDKVAKLLGLGYPGGPAIDAATEGIVPAGPELPRPLLPNSWDFSFSGLKTAVVQLCKRGTIDLSKRGEVVQVAAAFQMAVVEVLVEKTIMAAKSFRVPRVVVSGGVSANRLLRSLMAERGKEAGIEVYFPPMGLCMDNAAMVGYVAHYRFCRGEVHGLDLDVSSRSQYPRWNP